MGSENIVDLNEANFKAEVTNSSDTVLVDFWAPWCGPCKMLTPVLNELATEYTGKAKIAKVNVDDNQELAAEYGITGIPALLFFKSGKLVQQVMGAKSKRDLKATLDSVLAS